MTPLGRISAPIALMLTLMSGCSPAGALLACSTRPQLVSRFVTGRSSLIRADATDDSVKQADRTKAQQEAAEKRLRAERLKLQAERAELEAQQLQLQAEQLRLAAEVKRKSTQRESEPAASSDKVEEMTVPPPAQKDVPMQADASAVTESPSNQPFNLTQLLESAELAAVNGTNDDEVAFVATLTDTLQRMSEAAEELQLSSEQVELMRNEVFDMQSFYVSNVQQTPLGTIFRGNLRKDPDRVYDKVMERMEERRTLQGVRLLLLEDPIPLTLQQLQDGEERRPVFLALGSGFKEMSQPVAEKLLAAVALSFAYITTLGYALSSFLLSGDGQLIEQLQAGDTQPLEQAAPIAAGLLAVQLVHELAHFIQAKRYGLRTAFPVIIPSLQLGFFGAVTRLLSFPRNRKQLFDFALAGPAASIIVSLMLYVAGLLMSPSAAAAGAIADPSALPVLPVGFLHSSLLLGSIADALLPAVATAPNVQLDPLAIIGFTGALVNALQLIPVGRLDGGRMTVALFGPVAGFISGICLIVLGLSPLVFGDSDPILFFFALFVIFFQRSAEIPTANELTPVEDMGRRVAAGTAFLFMLLTLIPYPVTETATQLLI